MFRGTACEWTDAADAGPGGFLAAELAPFQIPFGDWFFCALVVRPPDKLAPDCKHLRNLYPADEKEGVAIRTGYRPLPPPPMPLRTHPSWRRRTEQKNSADADTKLPSQYGKLFQLNRGIQIEFRESPPISPRHKDDWLKTRIFGKTIPFQFRRRFDTGCHFWDRGVAMNRNGLHQRFLG